MRVKPGLVGHEVEEGGCWYAVGLLSAAARSLPAISCQFVCLFVSFLSPQPFISASHPPLFVFHLPQTPTSVAAAAAAAVLSAGAFCLLIIFLQSSAVYSFSVPVIEAESKHSNAAAPFSTADQLCQL